MRTELALMLLNERRHVQAGRLHHNNDLGPLWCRRLACANIRTVLGPVRAFLILAMLLSAAATSFAATAALEVTVSANSPRIGDRVPVRVTARGGEDLMWGELRIGIEAEGPWVVVESPHEMAGARPPVWELVLAPMAVGELSLPALGAGVRGPDGEVGEVAALELPTVHVVSVLPTEEEVQPVPLRDPVGVSGFPWEWVLPLAMPILGAALAFVWWLRRRRMRGDAAGVTVLAPFEELTALLDQLRGRIGREPGESICDRLAGGLRHYLERVSSEPAEEMTSFELRLLARKQDWPEDVRRGIQAVMSVADRVRFGRFAADDGELRLAIETSRNVSRCLEAHLAVDDEAAVELEAVG